MFKIKTVDGELYGLFLEPVLKKKELVNILFVEETHHILIMYIM